MAHDVFLSYSKHDKAAADAVCHALEKNRIRVWMAPRDVLAGVGWAQSIIGAINGARVMVLVFSGNANTSPQIEREVERAVHKGLPVVPIRIEDVAPSEALEYFISARHWLDAFTPPFEQHVDRLADAVKRLLESEFVRGRAAEEPKPDVAPPGPTLVECEEPKPQTPAPAAVAPVKPESSAKKANWLGAAAALFLVAAAGGGALVVGRGNNPTPKPEPPAVVPSLDAVAPPKEKEARGVRGDPDGSGALAWLGLEVRPAPLENGIVRSATSNYGQGLSVTNVDPDGPAAKKGLRPGDVILEVGGQAVYYRGDLSAALGVARKAGVRSLLLRVISAEGTHFVALPVDGP